MLGFSFTGSYIPAGSGVLTTLTVTGGEPCLSDLVFSSQDGTIEGTEIIECLTASYTAPCDDADDDGICDDVDDCVGEYDECGDCNGDGIADGACDCDGNVEDCAGQCGGSAVIDDCNVCGGDGSSCQETTVDVLYNSDADIFGFQFNVNGATVSGAGGGAAADAGFTVSSSAATGIVLGFSF